MRVLTSMTAVLLFTVAAHANGTIDLTASGSSSAKLDRMEFRFELSAVEDIAKDAIQRLGTTRKKSKKAFLALEIEGLTSKSEDFSVGPYRPADDFGEMMMFAGGGAPGMPAKKKQKIQAKEKLVVSIPTEAATPEEFQERMSDLIDTAVELGLGIGGGASSMLSFMMPGAPGSQPVAPTTPFMTQKVKDLQKLKRDAYAAALANASSQAKELASMAGLKIAGVKSIKVVSQSPLASDPSAAGHGRLEVQLQVVYHTTAQ